MKRWVASLSVTLMNLMVILTSSTMAHEPSIQLNHTTSSSNEPSLITKPSTPTGDTASSSPSNSLPKTTTGLD